VVWVNAHPGALVAPVVVGLFFAGAALGERPAGDRSAVAMWLLRGAIATTAVGLALLLNPFEAHVFRVPFAISGALADLPGYNPDWSPSWRAVRPLYFAALGGTTLVAVIAARRGARLDPSWVGVAAAMAALSLLQARQQPLFWIAAMALAGSLASASVWTRREKIVTRIAGTIVLLAVAGWALRPYGPWAGRAVHPELGTGIQAGLYPEAAVAELERTWPDLGPLYHDVAFGGYLLWRTFPGRQVFWDTRNELEPELLAEVGRARQDGRLWFAMLDRYEIDGALVRYDEDLRPVVELGPDGPRVVGHQTTNALFFPRPLFALVYWDDLAMLFVRRTPAREARLAEREYAFLHPEDWLAVLERSRNDAELRGSVREELERRLGETPVSQRALGMWRDVQGLPFPGGQTHR
jgi:hypothetical protein